MRTKLAELVFEPHPFGTGKQAKVFFPNGYGASVIQGPHFYTRGDDEYELAVLKGNAEEHELVYNTPLTDDVMGHLSESDVENALAAIEALV